MSSQLSQKDLEEVKDHLKIDVDKNIPDNITNNISDDNIERLSHQKQTLIKRLLSIYIGEKEDVLFGIWQSLHDLIEKKEIKPLTFDKTYTGKLSYGNIINEKGKSIADDITLAWISPTASWFVAWMDWKKYQTKYARLDCPGDEQVFDCELYNMEAFGFIDCVLVRCNGKLYDLSTNCRYRIYKEPVDTSKLIVDVVLSDVVSYWDFGTVVTSSINNDRNEDFLGILIGRKRGGGDSNQGIMLTSKILSIMSFLEDLRKTTLQLGKVELLMNVYHQFKDDMMIDNSQYELVGWYDPIWCEKAYKEIEDRYSQSSKKVKLDNI
jgi:hypothetical protein